MAQGTSGAFLLLLLGGVGVAGAGTATVTQVTTTTWVRNADGAPTAMIVQVDDQPAVTTYFTWDNFVPDAGDPATGTVAAGNGNLLGYGPTPGGGYTAELGFDQRNRLTSATVAGATGVTYAYDASSCMATSTLAAGDALQFFYSPARFEVAANLYQPSTDTWSSYLGDTAYLSGGGEQVRLLPRKDVAGQYDDGAQTFTPIAYEPYGATAASTPPAAAYDMSQNPFRYAGEYEDPVWGGYYLRARWYLPAIASFASRDPADVVRRYGYAAGNPITNTDPSGLRAEGFGRFVNQHVLKPLTTGVAGYVTPLFLGSEITLLEIAANPGAFWHQVRRDQQGTDVFLAASVASELVFAGADWAGSPIPLRTKLGVGMGFGFAQSITAGAQSRSRRGFDFKQFALGIEYAANANLNTRYFDAKDQYDPMLSSKSVSTYVEEQFQRPEVASVHLQAYPNRPTGPITDWWARVRGTPQEMYDVSISRDGWSYRVAISGPGGDAVGPYDPSGSAGAQIKRTAESFGLDLGGSRYHPLDSLHELDDAAVERRMPFTESRTRQALRMAGRAATFTATRIRGWISLLHYN